MTNAKSIMNKPITISKDASLYYAIKKLEKERISRLVIADGESYTSIMTEKDIGLYLLSAQTRETLSQIPVSKIMKPLQTVDESTSIKDCAKKMIENSIGSLVVKSDGLVGIITKTDLVKYFANNKVGKKIVGEYTTWYYAWMYSDATLDKIVQKMKDERVSRVVLRNRNEAPEGIIAFRDIFKVAFQANLAKVVDNSDPAISVISIREGFLSETGFGKTMTAKEIMSDKIIAVNYDDDLTMACQVLLENKINAVAVLSGNKTIIGILSKTDITRALAYMD